MPSLEDFKNGKTLLIDKPLNWTSFQVINKLRWEIKRAYNIKKIKVGHAGTLDPLASGLLIACTGKSTKAIQIIQSEEKEYEGDFSLGSTTPSFDLETEIDHYYPTDHITMNILEETRKQFIGSLEQTPPLYSAIKKDGKRLYEIARAGETTEIKSRSIYIKDFQLGELKENVLPFKVICSKGTYIRSLANDFGKALESGAHLSRLRRTRVGPYKIEDAISIEKFIELLDNPQ